MAATLLHLVDEHGAPVPSQVRLAVESAYRWAVREYRHIDQAVLAGLAESVAVGMCRRLDQIGFPRRYAFAALTGKLQEWYRAHPVVEIAVGTGRPRSHQGAQAHGCFCHGNEPAVFRNKGSTE